MKFFLDTIYLICDTEKRFLHIFVPQFFHQNPFSKKGVRWTDIQTEERLAITYFYMYACTQLGRRKLRGKKTLSRPSLKCVEEPREQARLQDCVFQLFIKTFLFSFRVQFLNMFHLCDYYFMNLQLPIVFPLSPWSPQSLRKTPMGSPVKNICPFISR